MPERIRLAPNCSLSTAGAVGFFASLCLASFGIAGLMAVHGFWPILPFAGAEMALLGWALRDNMRRRHWVQIITVAEDQIAIETQMGGEAQHVVFPRHWAQVKLRRSGTAWQPSHLTIESHGRSCELGGFLTEEERRGLAGRLQRLVGRINESPPLAGTHGT
jgi:uncharacterized membrane protein